LIFNSPFNKIGKNKTYAKEMTKWTCWPIRRWVSENRALLDIERGIILNLKHEAIGLWASHGPKNTTGPLTFKHTGIVAFDRIKNLYWKDYNPIAKGEAIIEPHIGSVDTIQVPIRRKWYYSTQMNDTDLARIKQGTQTKLLSFSITWLSDSFWLLL
jgi:hypothetical protein